MLQVLELEMSVLIGARARFQFGNLMFDAGELLLRFDCWVQT
jgi:hypothetical protein